MGYQDPGESRGDGREGGRRRSPYQARGRGMDRQEGNRGRDALGRQSFGAKSSGARGSQAAADALRKRQKANKAALTKRHAMYKSRTRLLHDFEERKAAANDVYVAPELPNILAKDEQSNGGKEAARKEECCEADDSPEKRTNNPATLSTHPEVDEKERKSRSRKHETDNVPCDNDGEAYGTESKFVVDGVPLSRGGVSQVARTGSSSKKALPVSAEGKISKSRKYMPFQKELDIAAARQRQIDLRHEKFAREDRAHKKRREKEASARKVKSKRFRKVTRQGQPVMKHRVDALLERIERGRGRQQ